MSNKSKHEKEVDSFMWRMANKSNTTLRMVLFITVCAVFGAFVWLTLASCFGRDKEYAVVDHYQELIDNAMCPVVGCGGPLETGWGGPVYYDALALGR